VIAQPAAKTALDVVRRRAADASLAVRYLWSKPTMLLVLGMHRSGTSCVSRILNLMGADLGSVRGEADAEPGEEIHWESPTVNWVNEAIFSRSGHTWHNPPPNPQFGMRDVWRCRRALWELGGSRIAAIKDPRMVITYAAWRRALPEHAIIACLRHPMNVARSLESRDGITRAAGLDLWYTYNRRLLERTVLNQRVYWFDFDAGADSARRLIRQLAADFPLEATPEALAHFNPADQHHRETRPVPGRVGELYEVLRLRARIDDREEPRIRSRRAS